MFNKTRIHHVGQVDSAEDLAEKLTNRSWTSCTAFQIANRPDYLWLCDQTSEDGAGEWGIVKRTADGFVQVESVTYSWMSQADALTSIQQALAGEFDSQAWAVPIRLDESPQHRCHLCA